MIAKINETIWRLPFINSMGISHLKFVKIIGTHINNYNNIHKERCPFLTFSVLRHSIVYTLKLSPTPMFMFNPLGCIVLSFFIQKDSRILRKCWLLFLICSMHIMLKSLMSWSFPLKCIAIVVSWFRRIVDKWFCIRSYTVVPVSRTLSYIL